MRKAKIDDYELFYMELPQTADYLNDIRYEDENEEISSEKAPQGLSDEQVSQIARDSLNDANKQTYRSSEDPSLFPSDNQSD